MRENQKGLIGIILILIALIVVAMSGYFIFLKNTKQSFPSKTTQSSTSSELAKRTYFKNNTPSFVIEEKSNRGKDGSLETIVSSEGKDLSRHLFFKDKIFKLTNGLLTIQKFKSQNVPSTYLTTGESFLRAIKLNPNLAKTSITIDGKKTSVYTIGKNQNQTFQFVKAAFAQNTDESLVKVYLDEDHQQLIKVEQLESNSSQPLETIEYQNGPLLASLPQEITEQPNPTYEQSQGGWLGEFEDQPELQPVTQQQIPLIEAELEKMQIYPQKEQIYPQDDKPKEITQALQVFRQLEEESQEIKAIVVETSIIPDQAIYLNPLSIIPTESGYNNKILEISSSLFNQQNQVDKDLKEKGYASWTSVKNNIRIRIDGVEINGLKNDPEFNLFPRYTNKGVDYDVAWTISLTPPPGLTPGYHTLEVFLVDRWYLAPNLMVLLPQDNNTKVLEITMDMDPAALPLPNNQGYQSHINGKNLIKPFSVYIGDVLIEDKNVEVKNEEELIITIPINTTLEINGQAYALTIIKNGQRVVVPRWIVVNPLRIPNITPDPNAKPLLNQPVE